MHISANSGEIGGTYEFRVERVTTERATVLVKGTSVVDAHRIFCMQREDDPNFYDGLDWSVTEIETRLRKWGPAEISEPAEEECTPTTPS